MRPCSRGDLLHTPAAFSSEDFGPTLSGVTFWYDGATLLKSGVPSQ